MIAPGKARGDGGGGDVEDCMVIEDWQLHKKWLKIPPCFAFRFICGISSESYIGFWKLHWMCESKLDLIFR